MPTCIAPTNKRSDLGNPPEPVQSRKVKTIMTALRRKLWAVIIAVAAFASLASLSFVVTPVKFLAEGVPLANLLAVGRVTFRASLALEIVLLSALALVVPKHGRFLVSCAGGALLVQWFLLMPGLDARTLARMAGAVRSPSSLHLWWIALDIARLAIYALIIRRASARVLAIHHPTSAQTPKDRAANS